MKRLLFAIGVSLCGVFLYAAAMAADGSVAVAPPAADGSTDVKGLEKRVEELEKRAKEGEIKDDAGHRYLPALSYAGIKIGGGLTAIGQGVSHIKNANSRGRFRSRRIWR